MHDSLYACRSCLLPRFPSSSAAAHGTSRLSAVRENRQLARKTRQSHLSCLHSQDMHHNPSPSGAPRWPFVEVEFRGEKMGLIVGMMMCTIPRTRRRSKKVEQALQPCCARPLHRGFCAFCLRCWVRFWPFPFIHILVWCPSTSRSFGLGLLVRRRKEIVPAFPACLSTEYFDRYCVAARTARCRSRTATPVLLT